MKRYWILTAFLLLLFLPGCDIFSSGNKIAISIQDGKTQQTITVESGSSVKQILDENKIQLNSLDKTNPSLSTILSEDATIVITRITEEYQTEQAVVPFEQQTVKNESLAEGQTVLIQSGANGIRQDTYRIVYENGLQTSRSLVSSEITQAARPEIVMIGVQSPFTPQTVNGTFAYISSSNAWVMKGNTSNRRLVVATGDLDGRIFSISPDQDWLLFSRSSETDEEINSLWLVDLNTDNPDPIKTGITNVVNYADWVPGRSRTFSYSTVEKSPTAPGWNANNDLLLYQFDNEGKSLGIKMIMDKNDGGISGWWGATFEWSTDGSKLAYARPDSVGIIDIENGSFIPLVNYDVYKTGSDYWAWVPGIKWSADDSVIYTTLMPQQSTDAVSPSLSAILMNSHQVVYLLPNCGLFCYPVPSPIAENGTYIVAYLSAIVPDQSETSRYNLKVMDRDGSNQRKYYPDEGIQGLKAQTLKWSPDWVSDHFIAAIAQGNLIFLDTQSGAIKQITGDGSISKLDWK